MFRGPVLSPRVALPGLVGVLTPGPETPPWMAGRPLLPGSAPGPTLKQAGLRVLTQGGQPCRLLGWAPSSQTIQGAPGQPFCKPGGLPGRDGAALAPSWRIQTCLLLMTFSKYILHKFSCKKKERERHTHRRAE